MCNKARHVKRFYTLMFTAPTTLQARCIGIYNVQPTELQINLALKRHVVDPLVNTNNALYRVDVVPIDIPRSILF
jgi:hypothetical protein